LDAYFDACRIVHCGLSALLILTFYLPLSTRTKAITLCVVFGMGVLQEGFQAFSQGTFSFGGSISDLAVDLAGGLLGLFLMGWLQ
jgi:VanZ family protein